MVRTSGVDLRFVRRVGDAADALLACVTCVLVREIKETGWFDEGVRWMDDGVEVMV